MPKHLTELDLPRLLMIEQFSRFEDQQNVTINDLIEILASQQTQLRTMVEQLAARKSPIPLPDFVIPAQSLISLQLGLRWINDVPLPGVRMNDIVVLQEKSVPAGVGMRAWTITKNDFLNIRIQQPIITIAGSPAVFSAVAFR